MTIHINTYFLYYWLVAIIGVSIELYFIYKSGKKKLTQMGIMPMITGYLSHSPSLQLIRKTIFSPLGFILGSVFLIIVAPFMFPFSVITGIKKIVGYKSKLEKQADAEEKQMEEAMAASKRESAEFMKNEVREMPDIIEHRVSDVAE